MKVTIEEAKAIIAKTMPIICDIEITDAPPPSPTGMNYVEAVVRMQYQFPDFKASQKIAAIKWLREKSPGLGLAEAKLAVEHPEAAVGYFIRTGQRYH